MRRLFIGIIAVGLVALALTLAVVGTLADRSPPLVNDITPAEAQQERANYDRVRIPKFGMGAAPAPEEAEAEHAPRTAEAGQADAGDARRELGDLGRFGEEGQGKLTGRDGLPRVVTKLDNNVNGGSGIFQRDELDGGPPPPDDRNQAILKEIQEKGIDRAIGSPEVALGGDFDNKLNAAMGEAGSGLVIGHGHGGMGLRGMGGTGEGGGGEGIGRIGAGPRRPAPARQRIRLEALAIEGTEDEEKAAEDVAEVDGEPEEPNQLRALRSRLPTGETRAAHPVAGAEPAPLRAQFGAHTIVTGRIAKPKVVVDKTGYFADLNQERELETEIRAGDESTLAWNGFNGPIDLSSLKLDGQQGQDPGATEAPPERFLPRMCYFENTYLGGNAAYQERLRRLEADLQGGPHLLAALEPQPFDAPEDAGLRLTAALDRTHVDRPGRVLLQVGLQGSRRYGWRRPPLDIVLVVDGGSPEVLVQAAEALLKRLGPPDRLAVLAVGADEPVVPLADRRDVRSALARQADALRVSVAPAGALDQALVTAGTLLSGADDQARVPGTRTVVLVTGLADSDRVQTARFRVQALAEQGVVTSVVALGDAGIADWWQVASAGNGNLHRGGAGDLGQAMEDELASLAKVIARLLRVNIRLAPNVEAIRVLGSRVLGQEEVREVKAREVATDRNLSRALGVKADRGDDDDGIQTVIPYFYGGDSHVILVELWVNGPGPVAEISLRYKDMVNLENATARTSTTLSTRPRADAQAQALVLRNLQGFGFSDALKQAAGLADQGDRLGAQQILRASARTPADRRVGEAFIALLSRGGRTDLVRDALTLAADRRIGAQGAEGEEK